VTLFPVWFFTVLVYSGILLASAGFITLITLLARDLKRKNVW
jgi:hypothetical protein